MEKSTSTDKLAVLSYFLNELPKELIKEIEISWDRLSIDGYGYDYKILPNLKVIMKDGEVKNINPNHPIK